MFAQDLMNEKTIIGLKNIHDSHTIINRIPVEMIETSNDNLDERKINVKMVHKVKRVTTKNEHAQVKSVLHLNWPHQSEMHKNNLKRNITLKDLSDQS